MKYVKACCIVIPVFILILQTNYHCLSFAIPDNEEYIFSNTISYFKSSRLGVNDSFTVSGSLISTINPTLLSAIQVNEFNESNSTTGPNIEIANETNLQGSSNSLKDLQKNFTEPLSKMEITNQTDNLSNNLVSMLSGIIIQSIERGNPTINNNIINDSSDLRSNNISIIVSGNWEMKVNAGNVTNFDSRFVMITSDGTGFHWHSIKNFKGNGSLFFGNDDTIIFEGSLDFVTDDDLTVENSKVIVTFNNFELIQIIFLDNTISDHFHRFPLYGIVDSIEIKN